MKNIISVAIVALILLAIYIFFDGMRPEVQDNKIEFKKAKANHLILDQDNAETVISKCAKVHGGKAAIERWRCGEVTYAATGKIFDLNRINYASFTDTFQFPGYFKRTIKFDLSGKQEEMTCVINQENLWVRNSVENIDTISVFQNRMPEHPFKALLDFSDITASASLKITRLENRSINFKDTAAIHVQNDEQTNIHFFFDLETGLLRAMSKVLPLENTKKTKLSMNYYSSYETIQGFPFPMDISMNLDDKVILQIKILGLTFLDHHDLSLFKKP